MVTDCKAEYFWQGIEAYVTTVDDLGAALSADPNLTPIGLYLQTDADIKALKFFHTVYVPPPFVSLFLESNISPVQPWDHLRGVILLGGGPKRSGIPSSPGCKSPSSGSI